MSLLLWAWLGPSVYAADQSDGVALPGATPLESTVSLGASAAGYGMLFTGTAAALGVEGSLKLSDRWSVLGVGGLLRFDDTGDTPDQAFSLVSLRYLAYTSDAFRLAPMLTNLMFYDRPLQGSLGLGVALEGGGEKLRGDLSIPILVGVRAGFQGDEYGLLLGLLRAGLEFGSTVRIGELHELRVGLPSVLTWRVRAKHVYFETSCTFLLVAALGTVEIGGRF